MFGFGKKRYLSEDDMLKKRDECDGKSK